MLFADGRSTPEIYSILQDWIIANPDFLWVPTGNKKLYAEKANVHATLYGAALVDNGGVINPKSNSSSGITFPTNLGLTGSSPFFGTMLVSIEDPNNVTGCFLKIGNDYDGVGFGAGNDTFDTPGNRIILLREGQQWHPGTLNAFRKGLNYVSFTQTNDGLLLVERPEGATNPGAGGNASPSSPSAKINVNGYMNRGTNATVHAVAIWLKSLSTAQYVSERDRLAKKLQPFLYSPRKDVLNWFTGKQDAYSFYSATSGTQTILLSRFNNAQTFYAASVSPGAVTISPSRFDNAQSFYPASIGLTLTQSARFDNNQSFYSASMTPGDVALTLSRFNNAHSFYTTTVTPGAVTLTQSAKFDNLGVFYSATISSSGAPQSLTPGLFSNSPAFYSPAVTPGLATLAQSSRFDNANEFYSPLVSLSGGLQILLPSLFSNAQSFHSPSVVTGLVTLLQASVFNNSSIFYGSIISQAGAPQTLLPELFSNDQSFFSATVTGLNLLQQSARFENVQVFYSPSVSVTSGPQTLLAGLFANSSIFYSPTITGGSYPTLNDLDIYYNLSITTNIELSPSTQTAISIGFFQ